MERIKILIRSVLMSSKEGVPAHRFQKDFRDLTMDKLNPREYGFNSIQDFMASMRDVVRVTQTHGEVIYHAVETAETQHIKMLVSNQKSKIKKSKVTFKCRAVNQRASYQRPRNFHRSIAGSNRNVTCAGYRQTVNKPVKSPPRKNVFDLNKPKATKNIKSPPRQNSSNINKPNTAKAIKSPPRNNVSNLDKPKTTTGTVRTRPEIAESNTMDGSGKLNPVLFKNKVAYANCSNSAMLGKVKSTNMIGLRKLGPVMIKNKTVYVDQPDSLFYQGLMGKLIVVKITRVMWPDIFMVPVERLVQLETITTMIAQYFSKESDTRYCHSSAGSNGIYAAICDRYTEPVWRRVEIGNVFGKHTSVYLVDSGEMDVVPTGSLRCLPRHIVSLPKLAMVGRLGGIVLNDSLSLDARNCFEKIVTGHQLTAHVMDCYFEKNLTIYDICVYRDNGEEVECINDEMVSEWKVADYLTMMI